MQLTNRADLPQAIVDAVKNDGYSKGDADYSVTGLLKPPRQAKLEKEHWDEIEEDVSDRIWSLLGQTVHSILERANRKGVAERRLSIEVDGVKVSGGMDLFDENGVLTDYKVTSVWKLLSGDVSEWEKQLNLYAVILRANGHKVEKLEIVCILRDWSKMEAGRDPAYPQAQVVNVPIAVWAPEKAEALLKERLTLHRQAEIVDCSKEDRWARPDVYAVMKDGQKRAVKLFDNEAEAIAFRGFDKKLSVVHRPGISVRCEAYCRVSKFCPQFRAILASSAGPTEASTNEPKAG